MPAQSEKPYHKVVDTLTAKERALSQEWAVKVQALESELEQVVAICHAYLEGEITAEECANRVTTLVIP
jgi:hypothetical protein